MDDTRSDCGTNILKSHKLNEDNESNTSKHINNEGIDGSLIIPNDLHDSYAPPKDLGSKITNKLSNEKNIVNDNSELKLTTQSNENYNTSDILSDVELPEERDSDSEWQVMPGISSYDVYDDNGNLALSVKTPNRASFISLNNSSTLLDDTQKCSQNTATFGYTKVADEKRAQRSYATNRKTDFLFNNKVASNSLKSLNLKDKTGSDSEEFEDNEFDEQIYNISKNDQLNITKNLLSDTEKFAYLGSISVLMNEMCANLAKTCILSTNIKINKRLATRLQRLQTNMAQWKDTILKRLYNHLGVSKEEIDMLEKLSLHGIELNDLCKCIKGSQVIKNPWNSTFKDTEKLSKDVHHIKDTLHLEIDIAWTVICDMFLLLIQDSVYDSRSRTLLINFANVLAISRMEVCEFEKRVIDTLELEQSTEDQIWDEQEHMENRRKKNKKKKLCYVGLATIGGSLILGLSGGLLAPVIGAGLAAGISTVGATGVAGFLTGVGGTTVVAVSSTAIGARIGSKAMQKRMGSVKTFEFRPLHNNRRVNLIVSVSGWMIGNEDDVRLPFSTVDPVEGDLYSLYWEPEMLKSTGQTINILATEIVTQTIQQILGATVLTALMAAIQVPNMLSKLGYIIDNPWNVSLDRAWAAGLILADTLISKNLGQRPITLIGFSLGSRVIYSCLLELCKRGAIGIVENVYLFGAPIVYNRDEIVMARSIVSGRIVNGYSEKDWILGYLFRATSGGLKTVAGISPITNIAGIDNMNCTELIEGHMAYRKYMPKLLKMLGIAVLSEDFVEIDDTPDPEQVKRQRKLVNELEDAQKKLSHREKKKNSWVSNWFKPKKNQWQIIYEQILKTKDNATNLNDNGNDSEKDTAIIDALALVKELEKLNYGIDTNRPSQNQQVNISNYEIEMKNTTDDKVTFSFIDDI